MTITAQDLKAVRLRLGESQAAFAKRFGCDQTTIHRWETEGPPASGMAARLVEIVMRDLSMAA